jgi:hypothetical protein
MPPKAAAPKKEAPAKKDNKKEDGDGEKKEEEKGKEGEGESEKKEGEEGKEKEGEKKEGEGDEKKQDKDKDEKGNCVGEDTCAGKDAADSFKGPNELLESAKKKVDDGVKNGIKTLVTAITNPAKCVALSVGAVPTMIDGIGNSIAGAFDNITLSINNTFNAVGNKGFDGIFAPFQIANAMFLGKLQDIVNNIALGPDAEKILSNPNITAKILFDKLVLRSKLYKLAIEDAELRGVLKKWIAGYVNTLLATLKIAQPEIDRINAEVKNIIEGMGDNIGESLGHALTNIIASVLSALPVVGGVVSAIKSADQLGQEILNACAPPIAKGAGIIMPVVNGFNKQKSRLNCEVKKLEDKVMPIMNKIENKMNTITNKMNNKLQAGGGGTQTKTKKHIQKTTKRINYLLGRFTSSRKRKINYTRRLHIRRG